MRDTTNDIKAGDIVTFNKSDDTYPNYHLTPGKEYLVKSTNPPFIVIAANDHGEAATWYAHRFTKVERKFQKGDVVECIGVGGYPYSKQDIGDKYVVAHVSIDGSYLGFVGVDNRPEWSAKRFKLAGKCDTALAPTIGGKWIVCALDSKGNIKPSSTPRIMSSEKQAITVSKSMAADHIGTSFAAVSYVVGKTFRAEPVEVKTVSHEVRQVG